MTLQRLLAAVSVVTLAGCNCSTPPAVETPDSGPTCTANVACTTNPGAPCKDGKTSCSTGQSVCVDAASAPAGKACAAGQVCDGSGGCVACAQGSACGTNPSAPCRQGTLDCAGGPSCKDGAPVDGGVSCGTDLVCSGAGACVSCAAGQGCATNAGAPCRTGVTSCSTGARACLDATALDAGTTCGTNQVCSAAGQCVACAGGSACTTNPGAPCTAGVTSCATGAAVCLDGAQLAAGAACGGNLVCSAAGACVACAAGTACSTNPGAPCVTGLLACTTGAPVCLAASGAAPGLSCGADLVCTGDGGCTACAADAGCQPGANPCIGGAVACSSGAPVCAARGPLADGTTCPTGSCLRGVCEVAPVVATTISLSTDTLVTGRSPCADAPSYPVTGLTATTATVATPPGACLAAGDEVLLINEQGSPAAVANVGVYELLAVESVSGSTVTFTGPKARTYGEGVGDDANVGTGAGQQRVALVRVPHYGDLTITDGGTLTVAPWDGRTGGVLAFRAAAITVDGTISVRARGYRDGRYSIDGPCSTSVVTEQGESIAGPPAQSTAANFGGSGGAGAASGDSFNGNTPMTSSAGHASAGQAGNNYHSRTPGAPGQAYGSPDGGLLTLGSGAAGNLTCNGSGAGPSLAGGSLGAPFAGGTLFIGAASLAVSPTGRIIADAAPGSRDSAPSGGSIMLRAKTLSLGANRVTALGATAVPGSAVTAGTTTRGSDGYIWLFSSTAASGTTTPAPYTELTPNP